MGLTMPWISVLMLGVAVNFMLGVAASVVAPIPGLQLPTPGAR